MDRKGITAAFFIAACTCLGFCLKLQMTLIWDDCTLRHGSIGYKGMLKGDPKYGVPVLEPLEITEIKIEDGSLQTSLSITMKDIKIYGLSQSVLKKARFDLNNKKIQWIFIVPNFEIITNYEIAGQILILPIRGSGPGNLTLTDLLVTYDADYSLIRKKNGREYAVLGQNHITFDTSRLYIKLDNLFNGNKELGDTMNTFLNENWQELKNDIGPSIAQALAQVMKQILGSLLSVIPLDEMFPEKV